MRVRPFADDDLSLPFWVTIVVDPASRRRGYGTATYAWTHAEWSPVASDFATALSEDLEDELDLEASSAAIVDGDIVALSLVYRDSTPPILTAETTSRAASDGERLVEANVRRSLDVLAGRSIDLVTFDGHVTDPHFLPVWAWLAPAGRWFRLVEIPPAGGGG